MLITGHVVRIPARLRIPDPRPRSAYSCQRPTPTLATKPHAQTNITPKAVRQTFEALPGCVGTRSPKNTLISKLSAHFMAQKWHLIPVSLQPRHNVNASTHCPVRGPPTRQPTPASVAAPNGETMTQLRGRQGIIGVRIVGDCPALQTEKPHAMGSGNSVFPDDSAYLNAAGADHVQRAPQSHVGFLQRAGKALGTCMTTPGTSHAGEEILNCAIDCS